MSEKLGRVNQELCECKGKVNKLQESLESLETEHGLLQNQIDAAELAETGDEKVKSLEIQALTDSLQISSEELNESRASNDELSAQVKHLTTKSVIEKEKASELEEKVKRLEDQIGKTGTDQTSSSELEQKLQSAT